MVGEEEGLGVLARGEGWLVVDKPSGLVTHRGPHTRRSAAALQRVRDQEGCEVYPIHRLDAATSGCLLFATVRALAGPLSEALQAGQKTYVAQVRGVCPPGACFTVQAPLVDDNGISKEAETALECLGGDPSLHCALVLAWPQTGRFHQVRRHLRRLSHPILGDREHGDSHANRAWRARGLTRLALHCAALTLTFPGEAEARTIWCPLPPDLRSVWQDLPLWPALAARMPDLVAAGPQRL